MTTRFVDFWKMADGILATTSMCLEGEAVKASQGYTNVLASGISVNPRAWVGSDLAPGEIKTFLDGRAEGGVIVISFGSALLSTGDSADGIDRRSGLEIT